MKTYEAIRLYNELSNMPELHNEKPYTGCFIRAKKGCEYLTNKGFDALVVITDYSINRNIQSKIAYEYGNLQFEDTVNWGFHVAAAAFVSEKKGREEVIVFDTALFNGPVNIQNWAEAMSLNGVPFNEDDIKIMDYNHKGYKVLDKIYRDIGAFDEENFFSRQQDKYYGKKLIKNNSPWLKKNYDLVNLHFCNKMKSPL